MRLALSFVFLLLLLIAPLAAEEVPSQAKWGHSQHGVAFDAGPRQRPWKMDGLGDVNFPITTDVPEVQDWFNQGLALVYSFWEYEAERSFRWCLKLDPDCAMAYWGLALCTSPLARAGGDRYQFFLKEAIARQDSVTQRERDYITAFQKAYLPELSGSLDAQPFSGDLQGLGRELELLVLKYPRDVDAKAMLAFARLGDANRYGQEAILREIDAANPNHPASHHFRIHTWDGKEGDMALDSCARYGELAWESGHANHMPGHVYSGVGMWHEAAIWMDRATRVEQAYMQRHLAFPYDSWNYSHNRNYLSFIQEQLGLPTLALAGARQLLDAPHDPEQNPAAAGPVRFQGMAALIRGLVKYERWTDIRTEGVIPWGDSEFDRLGKAYCLALAAVGLGDLDEAIAQQIEFRKLKSEMLKSMPQPGEVWNQGPGRLLEMELAARIAFAQGERGEALRLLANAAAIQEDSYRSDNDPPTYPVILSTLLGEFQLASNAPTLAAESFMASLNLNPNDAFALAGLVRAEHAAGRLAAAQEAYNALLYVWSEAEPNLRWLTELQDLGLKRTPKNAAPRSQRSYRSQVLDAQGPQHWEPFPAPQFDPIDAAGQVVSLAEYSGKPTLLVFYLGAECTHCVEQLQGLKGRASDFAAREVQILAISSQTPAEQAAAEALGGLPCRLLSDTDHANARRFRAYDEFEDLELHATILIDGAGRVRWAKAGGDPFTNYDFLLAEIDRIRASEGSELKSATR